MANRILIFILAVGSCVLLACSESAPPTAMPGDEVQVAGPEGGAGAGAADGTIAVSDAASGSTGSDSNMDAMIPAPDASLDGGQAPDASLDGGQSPDAGSNAEAGPDGAAPAQDGGVTANRSTNRLIDEAVANGTLTEELGILYRVYALFEDPRLPAIYRGVPEERVDSTTMLVATYRFPTLSAQTQDLLRPFFVAPIYANSWLAMRMAPAAAQARGTLAAASLQSNAAAAATDLCEGWSAFWKIIPTANTRVHYWDEPAGVVTANAVAAEIETVWDAETKVFGKVPPADDTVTTECNGGDAKLDIYVVPTSGWKLGPHDLAATVGYVKGCLNMPSKILVRTADSAAGLKDLRSALAHEFFHTLQLGYYNASGCDETLWLGEATGNWAMDLVYKDDQYEQLYAQKNVFLERKAPIDQPWPGGEKGIDGYCDYLFCQYLARKFKDNTIISSIWDATVGSNSVSALASALSSRGGLLKVWPDFGLALWNDSQAKVQDEFFTWDKLDWGLKKAFDTAGSGGDVPDISADVPFNVDLKGASHDSFKLLASAAESDNPALPRLSVHANYLKFTDPNVRSVGFMNPLALAPLPELKVQALVKRGGQWQPAEDWTKIPVKTFCRDKIDERIEEVVLIYTNATSDKSHKDIPFPKAPQLAYSNVGCWRWEGTSSIKTTESGTQDCSASNLSFQRIRNPALPEGSPGFEAFEPVSGMVTGLSVVDPGCVFTSTASGSVNNLDGTLEVNLDLDLGFDPPDRLIRLGYASSTLSTLTETYCPDLISSTGDVAWNWMDIPTTAAVSSDGKTIQGTDGRATWKLTAIRE